MRRKRINFFTNRRSRASSQMALVALGILILVILLGKFFLFLGGLQKPFSKDLLVEKKYTWDTHTSINIALKLNGVAVLNYDPVNKKIVLLKIPDETYMELPKGFGFWKVGSIYSLGQEEKPPVGAELLKQSLSKLLGLPIDGFIAFEKEPPDQTLDKIFSSLHANPFSMINFIREVKTDFTPLETIALLRSLSSVRKDNFEALDLSQSNITDSELLPDQSRVLGVDNIRMDLYIRDKMSDYTISSQGTSVAVFNATSHAGLAQDAARMITNMGGNVIFVTNTENYLQKSIVTASSKNNTSSRLSQIFAPDCLKSICNSSDYKITQSRAGINVVLGEDFYKDHYLRN